MHVRSPWLPRWFCLRQLVNSLPYSPLYSVPQIALNNTANTTVHPNVVLYPHSPTSVPASATHHQHPRPQTQTTLPAEPQSASSPLARLSSLPSLLLLPPNSNNACAMRMMARSSRASLIMGLVLAMPILPLRHRALCPLCRVTWVFVL
jgi:hypothetical protein